MRALLLLLTLAGFLPGATSFIKDPATANSLGASATLMNTNAVAFVRATSAYNPLTDTIVGSGVRRQRTQVIGTTSYSADLLEDGGTNLLTVGTSGRFDRWTAANGLTTTADAAASPTGEVIAQTLTDPGASLSSAEQTFTVTNDSLTHTFSTYVKKTAGGTAPTFGVTLALTGGTGVSTNSRINTDTGAQQYGSNAFTTVETSSAGTWYRIITNVVNNTTGNTTLTLDVYPAAAAYGASVDDATATGSATCAQAMLQKADYAQSFISNRNCLLQTETLNTTWTKTRCTITSDSTANPIDGATNADTIVDDNTAANTHFIGQSFTKASSAIQFTFSTYIKQSGVTWALVQCSDTGITNGAGIYFDVANGVKGTAVALGAGWSLDASTITAVGSWYRCTITVTTAASATIRSEVYTATGDLLAIHNGINAAALICWGNQLVYGATAQTYWAITTNSSLSAADNLISTTAPSITAGTIIAVMRPYNWTTNHLNVGISVGSTGLYGSDTGSAGVNARAVILRATPTVTSIERTDAGGSGVNTVNLSPITHTNGVIVSIGQTWDATAVKGYINGTYNAQGTTLTAPYTTVNSMQLGNSPVLNRAYGGYGLFYYWASVLPPSSQQVFANGVAP